MNNVIVERNEPTCHPERSEGSPEEDRASQDEILRFAQDDMALSDLTLFAGFIIDGL